MAMINVGLPGPAKLLEANRRATEKKEEACANGRGKVTGILDPSRSLASARHTLGSTHPRLCTRSAEMKSDS
ncbi:hypothetical protein OsJ_23230 [Oryza sativa Japonica Group]|uniref:Uncharacterized protein n=1 Tax=Oryza sativa subsp. japonica TaxID=39947 RepID=A3BGY4_ORYSJ|nr:hypothetical protein OsJ_23230 [Oryza sativa Japonica Group]